MLVRREFMMIKQFHDTIKLSYMYWDYWKCQRSKGLFKIEETKIVIRKYFATIVHMNLSFVRRLCH